MNRVFFGAQMVAMTAEKRLICVIISRPMLLLPMNLTLRVRSSSYETKRTTYQQQLSVLDTTNCWLERMGRAFYDSRLLLGPTA